MLRIIQSLKFEVATQKIFNLIQETCFYATLECLHLMYN